MEIAFNEFEMCSFRLLSVCITFGNHKHNAYNACYDDCQYNCILNILVLFDLLKVSVEI